MLHCQYLQHIKTHFLASSNDPQFWRCLSAHIREFIIMTHFNLDPAIETLDSFYSPLPRVSPRDPVCMLRSLILMTSLKNASITKWVEETRTQSLFAVFGGFKPDDTPGIGTYYQTFPAVFKTTWPGAILRPLLEVILVPDLHSDRTVTPP